VAVGIKPNIELAKELGLELGNGGVLVDETLQAAPGIFCVGDIAAHHHPIYGRHVRVEHWQVAQKQGTACGVSVAGSPQPFEELPWFWSDQYDLTLQYLGNAVDFDRTIWRGDPGGESYSLFYLKDGVIDAVLSVNDGRTGRLSRELIRRRLRVKSDILSDVNSDLKEVAKAPELP
jgi:3-phenylpropionate/trans-cinnamate dioxygenase ferredoxin reductase component